jgi:hypothetical protein
VDPTVTLAPPRPSDRCDCCGTGPLPPDGGIALDLSALADPNASFALCAHCLLTAVANHVAQPGPIRTARNGMGVGTGPHDVVWAQPGTPA